MFSYSLNSLIVFYEVVKLDSFSRAADVLFMTQPGVSSHVAQLEAQTGTRLLIRKKGTCKLTKEGKIVFKYAEKIEATARGLETAIEHEPGRTVAESSNDPCIFEDNDALYTWLVPERQSGYHDRS